MNKRRKRQLAYWSAFNAAQGGIDYLLRVEFATDESAPVTSPYEGEVGSVTITDTGNNVSVADSKASWSTNVGVGDPLLNQATAISRSQGLSYKLAITSSHLVTGIRSSGGAIHMILANSDVYDSTVTPIVGALESNVNGDNVYAFVLQSTGCYVFRLVSGNWRLIWYSITVADDSYLAVYATSSSLTSTDYMRVWQLSGAGFTTLDALATLDQSNPSNGTNYTGDADALADLVVTQDGSPTAGEKIEFRYRVQDASNYWTAYLERNGGNTDWDFKLDSVSAGVATNRATVTGVGTVTRIRILTVGDSNYAFTYSGTAWTRRAVVSVAHLNTETNMNATFDAGNTVSRLISFPRESANYSELDNG